MKLGSVISMVAAVAIGVAVLATAKMSHINERLANLTEVSVKRVGYVNQIREDLFAFDAEQQRFMLDLGAEWDLREQHMEELKKDIEQNLADWNKIAADG